MGRYPLPVPVPRMCKHRGGHLYRSYYRIWPVWKGTYLLNRGGLVIASLLVAIAAVGCTRTVVIREPTTPPVTTETTEPETTATVEAGIGTAVGPPHGIWFCFSGGTSVSCNHDPGVVGIPTGQGYYAFQM